MPREAVVTVPVFLVFNEDADSWQARRTFVSAHGSIEAARESLPEGMLKLVSEPYKAEMVENYTYFSIEKHEVDVSLATIGA